MNIVDIIEFQKEKKTKVLLDTDLSEYKIWAKKHLELQIKLSNLAEETNCYKYWIDDSFSPDKNAIFKKYIDFLGYIFNFGLDKSYFNFNSVPFRQNDYCLSDQFLNLYVDINDLLVSSSEDHFLTLLEDTLSLGITLGYSEEEILSSFI